MAAEITQVNFRMPTALKERLEREAKANERSLTAEIIYRLQTTLEMDDYVPGPNAHPEEDARTEMRLLSEMIEKATALLAKMEKKAE